MTLLIAVPHDKLTQLYKDVKEYTDLPPLLIEQISTSSRTTAISRRASGSRSKAEGADAARAAIIKAAEAYQK